MESGALTVTAGGPDAPGQTPELMQEVKLQLSVKSGATSPLRTPSAVEPYSWI